MSLYFRQMGKRTFESVLSSYFMWMPAPEFCYHSRWKRDDHGIWSVWKRKTFIREFIYLILLTDDMAIRVHSSIDIGTGKFRESGTDRIQFQVVEVADLFPLHYKTRCNRTESEDNPLAKKLRTKVEEILQQIGYFKAKNCSICGGHFVLKKTREKRYIFACENYGKEYGNHDHPQSMAGTPVRLEDVGRSL